MQILESRLRMDMDFAWCLCVMWSLSCGLRAPRSANQSPFLGVPDVWTHVPVQNPEDFCDLCVWTWCPLMLSMNQSEPAGR